MKPKTINILIIDDHEIIVEGLSIRLNKAIDNVKCFFANNARVAINLVTQNPIDLVICDLSFRNGSTLDGFEIIKKIITLKPSVKSVAHTSFDTYRVMKKAIESGFDSFLDKGCSYKDFSKTVKGVLKQGNFESETMKRIKSKRYEYIKSVFSDSFFGIHQLSHKEIELVLQCVNTTDRNILANRLHISPSTVDKHFSNILNKLQLSNRKEITLFAMEFKDELERLLDY